jgi:hypothetical protein
MREDKKADSSKLRLAAVFLFCLSWKKVEVQIELLLFSAFGALPFDVFENSRNAEVPYPHLTLNIEP